MVDLRCAIFGLPERPEVCVRLRPSEEMCGGDAGEAFDRLIRLERLTEPSVDRASWRAEGPSC